MLIIRNDQMDVFRDYMREQFVTRMVLHMRDTFPDRTEEVEDRRLRKVAHLGLKKAQRYGIGLEDDIRRLIEFLVIYGPRMDVKDTTAWMGDILRRSDIDGSTKMDLIDDAELAMIRR